MGEFVRICVGFVMTLFVFIITGMIGLGIGDDNCSIPWMISTLGFGVCLTIILIQTGMI